LCKQKVHDFPLPPEVFWECLLVDLAAVHKRHIDIFSEKVEDQGSKDGLYFLDADEAGLGLEESLLEFSGIVKSEQPQEVVAVDVFFVELLEFGHESVVLLNFLRIFENPMNQVFGPVGAQKGKGLVHNVGLRVFLLVCHCWFGFIDLYIK